jgi:hypothetical protein
MCYIDRKKKNGLNIKEEIKEFIVMVIDGIS